MSKRFTDTEKWNHPWYRKLKPKYKCAWQYACDMCDFAGIWIADFEVMSLKVGEEIIGDEFEDIFKDKITKLASDRYFIKGFPVFQYADREGKLSSKNNIAMNALQILKKFGIDLSYLVNPPRGDSPTPQRGVKDKDMDKAKKEEEEKAIQQTVSDSSPGLKKHGTKSAYSYATSIWSAFSRCGLDDVLKTRDSLGDVEKEILKKFGSVSQIVNCSGSEVTTMKIKLQEAAKEVLNSS